MAIRLHQQEKKKYAEVLELDCHNNGAELVVEISKLAIGEDERLLKLAIDMFVGMAGYCSVAEYKKYFKD